MYDAQSRNEQDQKEQKSLYIRMFEHTKTYEEGRNGVFRIADSQAFTHPTLTHKILHFLQEVSRPVEHHAGSWKMWESPVKDTPRAKECNEMNVPRVKNERTVERQTIEVEVDVNQFSQQD